MADLEIGQKLGHLTLVRLADRSDTRRKMWECVCDCGETSITYDYNLKKGLSRSCGCKQKTHRALSGDEASFRERYRQYRSGAKNRGISFELSPLAFRQISQQKCFYCGAEPQPFYAYSVRIFVHPDPFICNGIDRKSNDLGYTLENSIPCCFRCNQMKSNMSFDAFIQSIKAIAAYQFGVK